MPTSLAALNSCDLDAFVTALGHLVEHSPWVVAEAFEHRPFASAGALESVLAGALRAAPAERQRAVLKAHPDLAGRLAQAGALTESSAREQAAAGLDRLSQAELSEIQRLNDAYRDRFGFPFVICARLNAKEAILAAMRSRGAQTPEAELSTAIDEVVKIARLRLNEVLAKET